MRPTAGYPSSGPISIHPWVPAQNTVFVHAVEHWAPYLTTEELQKPSFDNSLPPDLDREELADRELDRDIAVLLGDEDELAALRRYRERFEITDETCFLTPVGPPHPYSYNPGLRSVAIRHQDLPNGQTLATVLSAIAFDRVSRNDESLALNLLAHAELLDSLASSSAPLPQRPYVGLWRLRAAEVARLRSELLEGGPNFGIVTLPSIDRPNGFALPYVIKEVFAAPGRQHEMHLSDAMAVGAPSFFGVSTQAVLRHERGSTVQNEWWVTRPAR